MKVDHATICIQELDSMQLAFEKAGLAADYGGPHANGATHMALLGFEDGSYLELIAPYKKSQIASSPWAKLMVGSAGPGAWSVGTTDIKTEVNRLNANGIQTSGPNAGNRSRPDGKFVEWETASAGQGSMGAVLPFMIQDHTPREWRARASASVLGSGLTGIAAVVIAVRDLDTATALFRQAYGWEAPLVKDHAGFNAKLAHFAGMPVTLASPLQKNSWLVDRLAKFGDIPAAFLLSAPDLRQAAERFSLTNPTQWFGRELAWFDAGKLGGLRLGVIQD